MFFNAGNNVELPIPKARQSVNDVAKIEPPACFMGIPIHSLNSDLKFDRSKELVKK